MELSLVGLLVSGFLSSTLLPGGSEVYLAWMLSSGEYSKVVLLVAVTGANTLGSIFTYLLGCWLAIYRPMKAMTKVQNKVRAWINRYGPYSLLLSWLPIVGDPLCFVAGWLSMPRVLSWTLILLGKLVRYSVIVWMFS